MAEHLSECLNLDTEDEDFCICPALRAYGQRVIEQERAKDKWFLNEEDKQALIAHGYAEALDRAQEAVAALRHPLCKPFDMTPGHDNCECLLRWKNVDAAIDALKEKP